LLRTDRERQSLQRVKPMARQDPLRNFRYRVEIDGLQHAGFSEIAIGPSITEVIEYREGADRGGVRKLPGQNKYCNIVLKRGVTNSLELHNWRKQVIDGDVANARRAVVILVADENGADVARFEIREAWPVKYDVSDLNGRGNEVFIELLELVNEGVQRGQ
jgi:phage tail-like protein